MTDFVISYNKVSERGYRHKVTWELDGIQMDPRQIAVKVLNLHPARLCNILEEEGIHEFSRSGGACVSVKIGEFDENDDATALPSLIGRLEAVKAAFEERYPAMAIYREAKFSL